MSARAIPGSEPLGRGAHDHERHVDRGQHPRYRCEGPRRPTARFADEKSIRLHPLSAQFDRDGLAPSQVVHQARLRQFTHAVNVTAPKVLVNVAPIPLRSRSGDVGIRDERRRRPKRRGSPPSSGHQKGSSRPPRVEVTQMLDAAP